VSIRLLWSVDLRWQADRVEALQSPATQFADILPSNETLVDVAGRDDIMSLPEFLSVFYSPVDLVLESGTHIVLCAFIAIKLFVGVWCYKPFGFPLSLPGSQRHLTLCLRIAEVTWPLPAPLQY